MTTIKIPTFNEALKRYHAAKKKGRDSDSLSALDNFVLRYTPANIFRVYLFRKRLAAVIEEAQNKLASTQVNNLL